jgi:hypothetical protein
LRDLLADLGGNLRPAAATPSSITDCDAEIVEVVSGVEDRSLRLGPVRDIRRGL